MLVDAARHHAQVVAIQKSYPHKIIIWPTESVAVDMSYLPSRIYTYTSSSF